MARAIDANELMKKFRKLVERYDDPVKVVSEFPFLISKQPTVDAVEVVHGYWTEFNSFMTCSECDTDWYYTDNDTDRFNYCPNCGARMDGDSQ